MASGPRRELPGQSGRRRIPPSCVARSLTYSRYARSSRLAGRAPRRRILAPGNSGRGPRIRPRRSCVHAHPDPVGCRGGDDRPGLDALGTRTDAGTQARRAGCRSSAPHAVGTSRPARHLGLPHDHAARAPPRVRHPRVLYRRRGEGARVPCRTPHGRAARRDSSRASRTRSTGRTPAGSWPTAAGPRSSWTRRTAAFRP